MMMEGDLGAWDEEVISTSEESDNGAHDAWADMVLSKLWDNRVTIRVLYRNPTVVLAFLTLWLLYSTAAWIVHRKISFRMDAEDDDCIEDIIRSWARRPRRRVKILPLVRRLSKEDTRDSTWKRRAWLVVLRARCEMQRGALRSNTIATGEPVGGRLTPDEFSLPLLNELTTPCLPPFASGGIDEGYDHRRYPGGTTSSEDVLLLSFQISAPPTSSPQPYVELLTRLLLMKEEDVFRRIVQYL